MPHIAIISSSVRRERKSHNVVLYFKTYLEENDLSTTEILDLKAYNFPIFDGTLQTLVDPAENVLEFAEKIKLSDGIIIVTPEYNGGYPASLKNAIDLLYEEWKHKPIAIVTVSSGPFGGSQALVGLQFTLWKMKAWTIPAMFPVPMVDKAYDENGKALDKLNSDKLAAVFIKELLWCIEADKAPQHHPAM
ncbi:NADPH-dependent FMN reductase [Flavobacterium sp.]|uniref:NADPH-dependent FMN reductase n=1 Tax=Flavobacterium sp. TaxID=239 RepID=UPI003BDC5877